MSGFEMPTRASNRLVACARAHLGLASCLLKVTQGVNGPLLVELARNIDYHDTACVEMFREGADIAGTLEYAGNGWPVFLKDAEDLKTGKKTTSICCAE